MRKMGLPKMSSREVIAGHSSIAWLDGSERGESKPVLRDPQLPNY